MIDYVLRSFKRFAVLIPGIVIAYLSIHDIFPVFDKRLPLALAIFLTYVLGAYLLIPAAIRFLRIFFPARHLPLYCVTPDGFASDPINVGIIGTRAQLIKAMETAGWHVAEKHSPKNVVHELWSAAFNHSYPTAPMSNLYLFGRRQDIGFEIPIPGERGHRHHVRFWATTYKSDRPLGVDSISWHERRSERHGGNLLWLGAASRDVGYAIIRHNVQVTHMIDPDTDVERDMIVHGLQHTSHELMRVEHVRLGQPSKLANRAFGGYLHTDGILKVVKISKSTTANGLQHR